jgi:hypothetical protein
MDKKVQIALAVGMLTAITTFAQDSLNVTKIGELSLPLGYTYGVAVFEPYLYVADGSAGLRIADVSDPTAPVEVGYCPTPDNAYGVAVSGSYAYVACSYGGMLIVDISDPARPTEIGLCELPGGGSGIALSGSYAYLSAGGSGMRVIDISNPAAPVEVGYWIGYANGVAASDSFVYVSQGMSGLVVIDVSNPIAPLGIGYCGTSGYANDVTVSGIYAYVPNSNLAVVDVSIPTAPIVVGSCTTPGGGTYAAVSGSYVYLAEGWGGDHRVIDVSDPNLPSEVGYYIEPGYTEAVAVSGLYHYVSHETYVGVYQFSPPEITVTLTPVNPPIQLPASGGSFDFNIEVANTGMNPETFDIWTMVTLPNSSEYGPIINVPGFTAPASWSGNRDRTQLIPAGAPAGMYTYDGYVGTYPDVVWDEDHFDFEKLTVGDGSTVTEWACWGESFEKAIQQPGVIPEEIYLSSAFPNPFNPATTIRYGLSRTSNITITIFDVAGRLVATLVNGHRDAGHHEITFDASNLASGLYIYRIEAGDFIASSKMVLLK